MARSRVRKPADAVGDAPEVVKVFYVAAATALIKYRRADGIEGSAVVDRPGWGEYWPPGVGDLVSVTPGKDVTILARPRGGKGGTG